MKYAVILGDGMADLPGSCPGGRTPLELARTPVLDRLCGAGETGLVQTVPEGMAPGSDTANLSILGYGGPQYYRGRASLEARAFGVRLGAHDLACRCDLTDLLGEGRTLGEMRMGDPGIPALEGKEAEACKAVMEAAGKAAGLVLIPGKNGKCLLLWKDGLLTAPGLTYADASGGGPVPPHEIAGKRLRDYLPQQSAFRQFAKDSYRTLKERFPQEPACFWPWGAGTACELPDFSERTGLSGAAVTATGVIRGLALAAGLKLFSVPGADGSLDTDYEGKARAALRALLEEGMDFCYVHLEAPDAAGHKGSFGDKVRAIENLDRRLAGPIYQGLRESGEEFRLLVLPDHGTPAALRHHTAGPVPYLLYDSRREPEASRPYCEKEAEKTGILVPEGKQLMDRFLFKGV